MGPRGTYRPCHACQAPIMVPFPADWEVEMVKEGPPQGPVRTFITLHRDGCTAPYADPRPGIAVRISGRYVTGLDFNLAPGAVITAHHGDEGGWILASLIPDVAPPSGWTEVGQIDMHDPDGDGPHG